MNEHLKPIFEVLLPGLEDTQIDYWVFGGISIAAYARKFIRENRDVDIFLRDTDFEQARSILDDLCSQNSFILKHGSKEADERPKVEVKIDGSERFSMIPVYQKDNTVAFKYKDGDQKYPTQILERVERNISGFRFFTSSDEFIKGMFINHIKARPDKMKREKIIKDAKAILNSEEQANLGFPLD